MSTYEPNHNTCEFTVRIKLNIPIEINPQLLVSAPPCTEQKIPIILNPDILLKPDVSTTQPNCISQNGQHPKQAVIHGQESEN